MFSYKFRNWTWVGQTSNKLQAKRCGRVASAHHSRSTKALGQGRKYIRRMGARLSVIPLKRLQEKSASRRNGHGSGINGNNNNNSNSNSMKRKLVRDAIDRDALRNMRSLRVKWRKEEDAVLKVARVVYLFLCPPVLTFNLVTVARLCRDIIRHCVGARDKTTQACLRRGNFLIKQNLHLPDVPAWLHLLKRSEHIQTMYGENFATNLRVAHPKRDDFLKALSVHFVLIFDFLYRRINKLENVQVPHFLIPDNIEEFNAKFKEHTPILEERTLNYWNPENEYDLQVAIVINVLHSSLCCTHDNTTYNLQSFEIYKNFSEEVLLASFKKARADGLVVALKRKNISPNPLQVVSPAYALSQRYRFRLMFLKIPYSAYDIFYDFYISTAKTLFSPSSSKKSRKPLELKSPSVGHLFFIAEGLAANHWRIDSKLPTNILTIDTDQRHTISAAERILDHYQYILDNAPETEYTKKFEMELNSKKTRIKFHPGNLSYKIQYTPYDVLSKMPSSYLHFFCALKHLQKEVEIASAQLFREHDDEEDGVQMIVCPFDCILNDCNYIGAIERLVHEKSTIIRGLKESPECPVLELSSTDNVNIITVQKSNLLPLVRMLESFWREKMLEYDRRDVGKVAAGSAKRSQSPNWCLICQQILQFNATGDDQLNSDEYEPTLHKEERLLRGQDVFAVNLPSLEVSLSSKLQRCKDLMIFDGVWVPKTLFIPSTCRDAILQKVIKESFWKYTEESFASLRKNFAKILANAKRLKELEEIHNYIESHKLGVTVTDLMSRFKKRENLLRAVNLLSEHYLIKRVGISSFMYVHKVHARPWMVHTFHIKRLERENIGGEKAVIKQSGNVTKVDDAAATKHDANEAIIKHEADEQQEDVDDAPDTKRARISKLPRLFNSEGVEKTELTKDIIVMKPQPWMRLNGSLNRRVLDKWLGAILTECIARNGIPIGDICLRFPHMCPADIMFLLEVLADLKCIYLMEMEPPKVTLFSQYEELEQVRVTELYRPEYTYVITYPDAFTRFTLFVGKKKYQAEFV